MLVDYELFGPVADRSSGHFGLLFDDLANDANDTHVVRANVLGRTLTGTALDVIGRVSHGFDGGNVEDCTAVALRADLFTFSPSGSPFFPIAASRSSASCATLRTPGGADPARRDHRARPHPVGASGQPGRSGPFRAASTA